jgi:hypothetical protein
LLEAAGSPLPPNHGLRMEVDILGVMRRRSAGEVMAWRLQRTGGVGSGRKTTRPSLNSFGLIRVDCLPLFEGNTPWEAIYVNLALAWVAIR